MNIEIGIDSDSKLYLNAVLKCFFVWKSFKFKFLFNGCPILSWETDKNIQI